MAVHRMACMAATALFSWGHVSGTSHLTAVIAAPTGWQMWLTVLEALVGEPHNCCPITRLTQILLCILQQLYNQCLLGIRAIVIPVNLLDIITESVHHALLVSCFVRSAALHALTQLLVMKLVAGRGIFGCAMVHMLKFPTCFQTALLLQLACLPALLRAARSVANILQHLGRDGLVCKLAVLLRFLNAVPSSDCPRLAAHIVSFSVRYRPADARRF